MWPEIAAHIRQATGQPFEAIAHRPIGGGCINQTYLVSDRRQSFFVKVNRAERVTMFEAEAQGLQHIWESQTIRVPRPICVGVQGSSAYLVLEWLDLEREAPAATWEKLGHHLAAMHRVSHPQGFGWEKNNTIGSTPQLNSWTTDWTTFFGRYRLAPQFQMATRKGAAFPQQAQLMASLPSLLKHQPQPALVHGDLWCGNAAFTASGDPVIFDPATYYGDREVDIAMTELFGGFPSEFYRGYNAVYPLEAGYQRRKTLYNLYHILNHYNLFGGHYQVQANRMIEQLLA